MDRPSDKNLVHQILMKNVGAVCENMFENFSRTYRYHPRFKLTVRFITKILIFHLKSHYKWRSMHRVSVVCSLGSGEAKQWG